jgi:hypothetical protein
MICCRYLSTFAALSETAIADAWCVFGIQIDPADSADVEQKSLVVLSPILAVSKQASATDK